MKFDSSWFPLKGLTKSEYNRDWMLGPTKFSSFKDLLTNEKIAKYTTVLWNRSLGNLNLTLDSYKKMVSDSKWHQKLLELGLPLDLRV